MLERGLLVDHTTISRWVQHNHFYYHRMRHSAPDGSQLWAFAECTRVAVLLLERKNWRDEKKPKGITSVSP